MPDEPTNDGADEGKTQTVEEMKAAFDAERALLKEQVDAAQASAKSAEEKAANVAGQLSAMTTQAPAAPVGDPPEPPDLINDTEQALDYHFQKRTGPIIAAQLAREVKREEAAIGQKSPKDWEKYGPAVKELIQKNRIPNETLAAPGSYDQLLNMVKAEHIDDIVKEKIADQAAITAADESKNAGSGVSGTAKGAEAKSSTTKEFTEAELNMLKKLDVKPEDAMAATKDVTYDGTRLRGEVVH